MSDASENMQCDDDDNENIKISWKEMERKKNNIKGKLHENCII